MVQLAPSAPSLVGGAPPSEPELALEVGADAASAPAQDAAASERGGEDAGWLEDGSLEAAGPDAAEAGVLTELSTFEREERAKDALDRAQKALIAGDREAARAALDEAERYDPEHPDIAELRRKL